MTCYKTIAETKIYKIQMCVNPSGFYNCRVLKNDKIKVESINHKSVQDAKLWIKRWFEKK